MDYELAISFGKNLLAGGFSGIVAKTLIAPIERVKLLLQTQRGNSRLSPQQFYSGPLQCFQRIYREEGLVAFWRGNTANVARYFPSQALNFALKDKFKYIFAAPPHEVKSFWSECLRNLAAGGTAGGVSQLVSYPFDLARTRLAVDVGRHVSERIYRGPVDCIVKVYRNGGFASVYRGFAVSFSGVVLFRSLFLGGYDTIKFHFNLEEKGLFLRYVSAQAWTTLVGSFCYPIDTIKRRLMVQDGYVSHSNSEVNFLNAREICIRLYKHEGIRGFYSGLSVNMIRGLSGALLLVGYDEAKKHIFR